MTEFLRTEINNLRQKIYRIIGKAFLLAINNGGLTQKVRVEIYAGESAVDMERMEEYGFETYPKPGSIAIPLSINGNREQALVMCVHDRRYRPDYLVEGEISLYTHEDKTPGDHRIHFKANRIINTKCDKLDEDIDTDRTVDIGNNDVVSIQNNRTLNVANNEIRNIDGNSTETIDGSESSTVLGSSTKNVTGNYVVNGSGAVTFDITGSGLTKINAGTGGVEIISTGGLVKVYGTTVEIGGVGGKKIVVDGDVTTTVSGHSHAIIASTTNSKAL